MFINHSLLKILLTLSAVIATFTAHAKPLKSLLMTFAAPEMTVEKSWSQYSAIKGLKGDFKKPQPTHEPYFSNSGRMTLSYLGRSTIELRGKNSKAESIFLSSSTPSKRFKQILITELGRGVVKELANCRSTYLPTQKSYQITFKNKSVIYVDADAVLSFKPTMSPTSTTISFYLERPTDWKC